MIIRRNHSPGRFRVMPVQPFINYPKDNCPDCDRGKEGGAHGFYAHISVPYGAFYLQEGEHICRQIVHDSELEDYTACVAVEGD